MANDKERKYKGRSVITIKAGSDIPQKIEKRKLGIGNYGVYCTDEECRQFFAMAVEKPDWDRKIEFKADPSNEALLMECPFCHSLQDHFAEEIELIHLTEARKRRPRTS